MNLRNYTAVYKKTKNWYVAWIEELPGAITQGKTLKETRENLIDAAQMMLAYYREKSEKQEKRNVRREEIQVAVPA